MSDADRVVLVRWSKRPTSPHSIAQRARIVLLAADGLSNNEVADKVGCNQATVVKWRKRFIERVFGDPDVSGSHEAAPDGFLMAYGGPVARGRQQVRASVVDIAPTILYFLGLPIGRDMDGFARADVFRAAFSETRPITFIPTYDK